LENSGAPSLDSLGEAERLRALNRFQILRPFLEDKTTLAEIARQEGIPTRTAWEWVSRYRKYGLAGLARKARNDKDRRRISAQLQHAIEGLALKRPRFSVATVQREAAIIAQKLGEPAPSYDVVYSIVRQMEPGLMTLAHEGAKTYGETFDLIHRTEAEAPNAIWQADHTQFDILVNDRGRARKPWLTIILDDYSRAVAGYALSFSAPSAIQTALALRQAIWRKTQPGWHICGIPQILYTDHGSDFTSHHIEQVTANLKIQLVFSAVGRPRGRGKIERFFRSLSQVLLQRLPGYKPAGSSAKAVLSLAQLAAEIENYLIHEYNVTPHRGTGQAPQARWAASGFLPQMPESLAHLDLLLLTVPKTRRVRPDGIHFSGMRYIDPTLAAYVGEQVLLRYDPRDVAEIRVFHEDRFLCRAVCQELAGETVPLREIVRAREQRRRGLRQTLQERQRTVDSLIEARRWSAEPEDEQMPPEAPRAPPEPKLKRYHNE
jgi:putative transposase